jgi:archaellum component FlaF (FlaF/FlaG flagellin family)
MGFFALVPVLIILINLVLIIGVLYLVFNWANKIISLKQENNELLREIINKMDNK